MKEFCIHEQGIYMNFEVRDDGVLNFIHFSCQPLNKEDFHIDRDGEGFLLNEVSVYGLDRPLERHGNKYIVTAPGYRMTYVKHTESENNFGKTVEIVTEDKETGLFVTSHFQFYNGIHVVRCYNVIENKGHDAQVLEHISTFNYLGFDKEGSLERDKKLKIYIPHNGWQKEMAWQSYTLPKLGMAQSQPDDKQRTSKRICVTNTGNWSTKEYLPMGCIENTQTETMMYWQIEHNGSWHWEISDQNGHLYVQLCGPTERESHWFKTLNPGERFETVPAAVGVCFGGINEAMGELTKYRRVIRRKNKDNETLPVIFNDYMNCLWGDPTTEKEIPMIKAAAAAGCEYYVIDAGWYAPGFWWDSVGQWQESRERFPGGLKEVLDTARAYGMVPGVWLELEVMGIKCPEVKNFPRECFFERHGRKIYDRSRYQLDFRHPKVRAYVTEVVRRLVEDYGVGYIKMDYNIEPGIGTDMNAENPGDGLLGHERAYLAWLDEIFEKYPELVIENCSSGGLRIDYALLSRYSIQSTSDQEDYKAYATVSANAAAALTPEQAAVWSYPMEDADRETVIYNMINAILWRIHQSGHLVKMQGERFDLIKEAIDYYKTIREDIKEALPFWPMGFADYGDDWLSFGLKTEEKMYVAVWHRSGNETTKTVRLPNASDVRCAYPSESHTDFLWKPKTGELIVTLEHAPSARLFELNINKA